MVFEKIRICLIGDYSSQLDEGYKNVAHSLSCALEKGHIVFRLSVKKVLNKETWISLKKFNPQITHILSQPTIKSLFLLLSISLINIRGKRVISALRYEGLRSTFLYKTIFGFMVRIVRPELVLVQSKSAEEFFSSQCNCIIRRLPNGVDLERFQAVDTKQKLKLREQYNLNPELHTILHVGHPIPERNISLLEPLVEYGFQVIVVISKYLKTAEKFIDDLRDKGFIVFDTYIPNIEELYQLSDCYIFPVDPGNSISMPLSILEALACNLPVISKRYDAIQERFGEEDGVYYLDSDAEIIDKVNLAVKESKEARSLVEGLSWDSIATILGDFYQELVNE
jgi:glycosyltransferase involved in cell wall biosynthesis